MRSESERTAVSRPPLARYVPHLLSAFAVVVASFLVSTYYTETRLADVDRQSAEITRDAMPTIVHLAVLRTRLHDLETALAGAEGPGAISAATEHALAAIDAELAAVPPPLSRRDDAIWNDASNDLALLVAKAGLLLSSRATDSPSTRDLMIADARSGIAEADHRIARLIELDANRGRSTGARLEVAEQRVTAIALGLDAASFVLSVAAALVALRVVRRSIALSERRAYELELFASRVAHDIRGPLTPALLALQRGVAALGSGHPLGPAFQRGIRCLEVVVTIIDDLLTFAKSGARPEADAQAPVREAVDDVVAEVASLAAERGVSLEVAPFPGARLRCAPGVLLSILSNLVRNAVKYVGEGPLRRVTIRTVEGERGRLRVEVSDTGPGLPEGFEDSVFEPYVRGRVGKEAGLGLGLATVRRLVESHGGRVGVRSRSGQGCVFWFELPTCSSEGLGSHDLELAATGTSVRPS